MSWKRPEYRRGIIGLSQESDEINLSVLQRKKKFLDGSGLGYQIVEPEETGSIPQVVIDIALEEAFEGKEIQEIIAERLSEFFGNEKAALAVRALKNPSEFCFRVFTRSHKEKERYRCIGLDLDRDVITPNITRFGAEFDVLWTKEPLYNVSFGDLFAFSYFMPSFYSEENLLYSTASSYLIIYHKRGIGKSDNFYSIKITDGEPLAEKVVCVVRVDWSLPEGISLPSSYGA